MKNTAIFLLCVFSLYSHAQAPRPMVLWLHGCTQTSKEFQAITKIEEVAKKLNLIVYAPEQKLTSNPTRCWNWFLPSAQYRSNYMDDFVDKIREKIRTGEAHPDKIYVGGFSAGAVMASHFALCYPDVFKGALIHSGAPYKFLQSDTYEGRSKLAFNCHRPKWGGIKLKKVMIFTGEKDFITPISYNQKVSDQYVGFFDLADDGILNNSAILRVGPQENEHQRIDLLQGITLDYYQLSQLEHAWSGGAAGYVFSNPSTIAATEIFFKNI